ncbi:aspartate 1-decarboxylase [Helicobacter aurati]|uniref:Aspartate 1-decarboxylase n=1 Tax=Helicobacter aurati TaxID=137778 RepID=A0A3D8J9K0_9HELI|nr:aspartate 1-decarboxylase [Helicobacter aurati]RDU73845.1 aspartate 1-decarboxylase [Helicobacter aurati]
MRADFLYAKIHRATVTDSNLNYIGSISLDSRLMKASGILEGMKVEIVNINNGERFSTYAIEANSCSKKSKNTQEEQMATVCLNGAAARKVQQGDIIIILAYANVKLKYAKKIKPKIVFVDSCNMITTTQE